ncbi:MAG: T9SS type A sorting domain-containing protein, partial [bacterium]
VIGRGTAPGVEGGKKHCNTVINFVADPQEAPLEFAHGQSCLLAPPVGVGEERSVFDVQRLRALLFQNIPNPFHGSTVISYSLSSGGHVILQVFDMSGRLVETLVDERQHAGDHNVRWEAGDDASGIYFYRLNAGDSMRTRKVILLR